MVGIGSSKSEAFMSGVNHLANAGRSNDNSITLNDSAGTVDQGLDQTSTRWAAATPHDVLATTVGSGSDDSPWERMQRESGAYSPGSMEKFQDQIDQASDTE